MKNKQLFAAAAVLAGAIALRLLLPNAGKELRAGLRELVSADPAYAAVFHTSDLTDYAQSPPEDARPAAEAPADSGDTTGTVLMRVNGNDFPELAIPTPTPEPAPEITQAPQPEAVETFLESQAAFAEYQIPDTVNYHFEQLPFDYAVPVAGYNSSGFGYRLHPILNTVRFHYGTDFAAWTGEQILAFADGTVTYAGYDDSFGWHLKIDHGDGWETLYAHCSRLDAAEGQQVSKGACVAIVGASGLATGPHLHFELTHNGEYLNPEYYING